MRVRPPLKVDVVKVDFAAGVQRGRHVDDAGWCTGLDPFQQEVGEQEVSKVVGA